MKVDGRHIRSIWLEPDGWTVSAIDQRRLPHDFVVARLTTCLPRLIRCANVVGASEYKRLLIDKRPPLVATGYRTRWTHA